MKTVKQTFAIILGLLFLSLQGCSHEDYIPVPGPAGNGHPCRFYRYGEVVWQWSAR